ncbi:MAG TPA: hypothetical protein VKS60_21945 [Stellaceae bacterium]|nr:hypothetical protein [Stellaceae bacterium]
MTEDQGDTARRLPNAGEAARRRRAEEERRLAAALRENLLKRKQQGRARADSDDPAA